MDAVSHLLRSKRSRPFAAGNHHAAPVNARLQALEAKSENETRAEEAVKALQKRLTPEQLESILSSESASARRAAATRTATTTGAVSIG